MEKINYVPPGPVARDFHLDKAFVRGLKGPVGCLPGDSEFLTPTGWRRMDEYDNDLVGVWNDGVVKFEPVEYVDLPATEFIRFDSGTLVMELSPEHRVPHYNWNGEFRVVTADEIEKHPSKRTIPTTFELDRPDAPMTDHEIRMRVMFSADGYIPKAGRQVAVCVRKLRKVARLKELLKDVEYKLGVAVRSGVEECCFRFVWPYGKANKSLDFVWGLSSRQLRLVVEESMHWDGLHDHREMRFHTTDLAHVEAMQFAAHATGRRASIGIEEYDEERWKSVYRAYIRTGDNPKNRAMVRVDTTKISRIKGDRQYCFTTSSGFFVARCEGTVFVTGNSGKSSSCCWEIVNRALNQPIDRKGTRRSRWVIIRNTYPELKNTTIKTWMDWFGGAGTIKWDTPIVFRMKTRLPDSILDLEVVFMALDRPEETGKLRSMELTGGWINEASETPKEILDMLTQRVGRFPPKRDYEGVVIDGAIFDSTDITSKSPYWNGVIMDTNPPDDDHWWYRLAEENPEYRELPDEKAYRFYSQPGGLMRVGKELLPNPEAENVISLPGGYDYYFKQVAGKNDRWIDVFLCGQYGQTLDGKPVWPEWDEKIHLAKEPIKPIQGRPILLTFDFGLTPACIALQMNARGGIHILREWISESMGIRQFYTNVVKPDLTNEFRHFKIEAVGDPAGTARAQTDEKSCMQELLENGLYCEPASTNEFLTRKDAVAFFLLQNNGFLLDPSCKMLRKAFNGGYRYERLQVKGSDARYKDRPVKDKFSHGADALQYGAMYMRGNANPVRAKKIGNQNYAW